MKKINTVLIIALVFLVLTACSVSDEKIIEAVKNGNVGIVNKYLAQKGDINLVDVSKNSLVHTAVLYRKSPVVKLLIEHGADLTKGNSSGMTPLHLAAIVNDGESARLLLEAGVDPDQPNKLDRGKNALHYAAINEGLAVAQLLLDNGVDINILCDIKASPIVWAAYTSTLKSVQFFADRGALLTIVDSYGDTALTSAKQSKKNDIYEYLLSLGVKR